MSTIKYNNEDEFIERSILLLDHLKKQILNRKIESATIEINDTYIPTSVYQTVKENTTITFDIVWKP
jgi:hypothetical protein